MCNHKKLRYLFLFPVVLMIASCTFFYYLSGAINETLLREKMVEKRMDLDLINGQIDIFVERDADWESEYQFYQDSIAFSVEILDAADLTFAAMYDEKLNNLSQRAPSYEDAVFDPTQYPEFVAAVYAHERGELTLWFESEIVESREMLLYYRWVPTNQELDGRFLTVIAISNHSVSTTPADWIVYGEAILIVLTTVLNLILVSLICRLGSIYTKRAPSAKWRPANDGRRQRGI